MGIGSNIKAGIKNEIDDILGRKTYQRYLEKERRKRRIAGHVFSLLLVISAGCYIVWCVLNANWEYWYTFIPFLMAELGFLLLLLLWINILWAKRFHKPDGPPLEKQDFSVDIFIPVSKEPVDLVEKTVSAASSIDYKDKKVYILDDGGDDNIKALAEKYKVVYRRRSLHKNRKAGNLNYGLEQSTGDLILVLDADQVPDPGIIDNIIGYFTIPRIGFVQTEQRFSLPEGDPWGNSDVVFYKVMMPGKDFDNAAISCGSGVMYRRTALASVGGFSTWNLVEDLHTSMQLHSNGWVSVYHMKPYTTGTAPREVISYLKQRWQWALDSLRIFLWDNPLKYKGLSWKQKLQYFHFGYNYIAFGVLLPIYFVLPIWALFTHKFMISAPLSNYVLARLPYFLFHMIANKFITDRYLTFKSFQSQAGLFGGYFDAFLTALLSKNRVPGYTVTSKKALRASFFSGLYRCFPHIVFVVFSAWAIIHGLYTITNDPWFLLVNVFWAGWIIIVLWRFIMLSLFSKWLIK